MLNSSFAQLPLLLKGKSDIMVYEAVGHVVLDQIWMDTLGETIEMHVDKYFHLAKVAKAFGRRLLCNDGLFSQIASFVEIKIIDAITDQYIVGVIESTSIASCANKDEPVPAEAGFVLEASARTRSESCSEESYKCYRSLKPYHLTGSHHCRNWNNK